jgi:formylglycine-generating enzyme required for sulfatase activity
MKLQLENSDVDGYHIIGYIAEGMYTEVYLAIGPTGEKAAIKALNPRLKPSANIPEGEMLEHFENEQEAMKAVRHRYVANLMRSGKSTTAGGVKFHYLAVEYLAGGTLREYMRRRTLTLQQLVQFFGPVCEALTVIHRIGIIHCDIKPSNLLLDHAWNPTLIKLSDFSVSKLVTEGTAVDRTRVGTSFYAAPEHHPEADELDLQQPLDARADVYALAMTIFHALTGQKPRHDKEQITSLPPHPIYEHCRGDLLRVLGRATSRRVAGRYPNVDAFWEDLKAAVGVVAEDDEMETQLESRVTESVTESRKQPRRLYRLELPQNGFIDLVEVPEGDFEMGTGDEETRYILSLYPEYMRAYVREWLGWEKQPHRVRVPAFWMSKYPVTRRQWRIVATYLRQVAVFLPADSQDSYQSTSAFEDEHPVTGVTWMEALEFCARLSTHCEESGVPIGYECRLPTEAEWEYACRAGTTTPFNFAGGVSASTLNYNGVMPDDPSKAVWRQDKRTSAVGHVGEPNAFNLYDMHGNVWEWCTDTWHENYNGSPSEGQRPWENENNNDNLRVVRGGSYRAFASQCRSASRGPFPYNSRFDDIGFRIVI